MADLDFILQAVSSRNHADSVRTLLALPRPTRIIMSVAFARTGGVDVIQEALEPLATKTKFFVGIRNDITSIQAIRQLLALNIELYAVDTGSRNIIFHPKLYLSANSSHAAAIVGSANMTFSGLHNNIEVSTHMALDYAKNPADKAFVETVVAAFDDMLSEHPEHVFRITDDAHAARLFEEGRLADETVVLAPNSGSHARGGKRDDLGRMRLTSVKAPHSARVKVKQRPGTKPSIGSTDSAGLPAAAQPLPGTRYLVWESKALTERDLNIPTGDNTNPTGSMGLKKGAHEIDHQTYFYEDVFKDLPWTPVENTSKRFRTTATFELVVKNVNHGAFDLVLGHITDTSTASFKQGQFMTQLHWGVVKPLIAKKDLLGRTLFLYRKDSSPPQFMIEID